MEQTILTQNVSYNMKNFIKLIQNTHKYHSFGVDIEGIGAFNKEDADNCLTRIINNTTDIEAEILNELVSLLLVESRSDYDVLIYNACSEYYDNHCDDEDFDEDTFDEELREIMSDAGMLPFTLAMYRALEYTLIDLSLDEEWLLANKDVLSTKLQELHKHYSKTNDGLSPALDVKDIVSEVLKNRAV